MPPSEVWAPWNKTKNYWWCQLPGMLFRGGGKLHMQHRLSSASSFLNKGWPQAISLSSTGSHAQIYKLKALHTYFLAGGFLSRSPTWGGFVASARADSAKGQRKDPSIYSPAWGFNPFFVADCLELASDMRHGLIWQCSVYEHLWSWSSRTKLKLKQGLVPTRRWL